MPDTVTTEKEGREAKIKKALALLESRKADALETYDLEVGIHADLVFLLREKGFDWLVRSWFIERLPDIATEGEVTLVVCPYCNEAVEMAFHHKDHVIPKLSYARYMLHEEARRRAKSDAAKFYSKNQLDQAESLRQNITRRQKKENIKLNHVDNLNATTFVTLNNPRFYEELIKKYVNDKDNLVLTCMRCNTQKGNERPGYLFFQDAIDKARKLEIYDGKSWIKKYENLNGLIHNFEFQNVIVEKYFTTGVYPEEKYLESVITAFGIDEISGGESEAGQATREYPEENKSKKLKLENVCANMQALESLNKKIMRAMSPPRHAENKYEKGIFQNSIKPKRARDKNKVTEFISDYAKLSYVADVKNNKTNYLPYVRQFLREAEPVIFAKFYGSATSFTVSNKELGSSQPNRKLSDHAGKLCFYCFGIASAKSFHLDHIDAQLKDPKSSDNLETRVAKYNMASNLLPVCMRCNTTKKDKPLTWTLLDELLDARLKDSRDEVNLGGRAQRGIEHAVEGKKLFALAWGTRARILRNKVCGVPEISAEDTWKKLTSNS